MRKVTIILLLLLLCFQGYSQTSPQAEQKSEKVEIYFDLDKYVIDSESARNSDNLTHLYEFFSRLQQDPRITITDIKIDSYASPEAGYHYNQRLTKNRTASIYKYLIETICVPDSLVTQQYSGIDWAGLRLMVENSDMKHRDQVLSIIDNTPEETWRRVKPSDRWQTLVDSRNKHLMDLEGGDPYRYMSKHFFPSLRSGSVVTIYFKTITPALLDEEINIARESIVKPIDIASIAPLTTTQSVEELYENSIRFAVKTNLLFDALLAPSIELEVPIGDRWSAAGEWIFPWWVTKNNGYALEILSGQIEGRYWLGDRVGKPQLTGWFAGLYAGGGLYDLQWANNGYQGEFYIAAGASAGYAHTINKRGNLRMEYSLGLGYLSTEYRYYEGKLNNEYLVWQHNGRYTWLGPTKAKVSLVWFIDWKRGGKR